MSTQPKIALSSRYSRSAGELLAFARKHDLDGIEYTVWAEDDKALEAEKAVMRELAASEVEIRYHFQFRKVELAHKNEDEAQASAAYLKRCLSFLHSIGGKSVITHLCLGYRRQMEDMSLENAVAFLSDVGAHARSLGMEICLENLTYGFINNPEMFCDVLRKTGVPATIDIGHVAASPCVLEGRVLATDYITRLAPWLHTAHIYDIELPDPDTGKFLHHAPKSRDCFADRIRALAATDCSWWLIELGEPTEILRTRDFLREILREIRLKSEARV